MKRHLADLKSLLSEARARGDTRQAESLRNAIRGLENSISGRYT